jgi:hypothetical protein
MALGFVRPKVLRLAAQLSVVLAGAVSMWVLHGPTSAHAARPTPIPKATEAATIAINETVRSKLVSHRGTTAINERGSGSGTFSCPLTVQISIAGDTEATISFTCNTRSGTISGRGVTSYAAAGPVARFSGALQNVHGTGRYAHASSAGLHIEGTLTRHSYALSARVVGKMHV